MKKVFLILAALVMVMALAAGATCEDKDPCKTDGHKEVFDAAVEPTCTEPGRTEGSHCSVCGKVLKKPEEIPPLQHLLIAWYPNREGNHIMVCSRRCGYQDVQLCRMTELPQADPEAESVSFCPICGYCEGAENMAAVKGLKILNGAPKGSLRVFSLQMGEKKYMTFAFDYSLTGELVQPEGEVTFSLPEEMKDASFTRVDSEGVEWPVERTSEGGVRTLKLDFAPEGKDPVPVMILSIVN